MCEMGFHPFALNLLIVSNLPLDLSVRVRSFCESCDFQVVQGCGFRVLKGCTLKLNTGTRICTLWDIFGPARYDNV